MRSLAPLRTPFESNHAVYSSSRQLSVHTDSFIHPPFNDRWDSNHPWNPEEEEGEESEEEVETESDEDDGGSATTGAGQSSEFKSSEFKSQEFKL